MFGTQYKFAGHVDNYIRLINVAVVDRVLKTTLLFRSAAASCQCSPSDLVGVCILTLRRLSLEEFIFQILIQFCRTFNSDLFVSCGFEKNKE